MGAGVVPTGPLWLALTCADRFRAANLLAYLPLPGGLALTCTALHLTALHLPVFDMVFTQFCQKNLIINITQIIAYI